MTNIEYKAVCSNCGRNASAHEEKSNDNWTVYKERCESCGGETKIIVVQE